MKLKIKRTHPDAVLPKYGSAGAVGADVKAVWKKTGWLFVEYGIGLAMTPPPGHEIQIRSRSSISKKGLILCNGIGTGDPDYTGEYRVRFYRIFPWLRGYKVGDSVAQIICSPVKRFNIEVVENLDDTDRGEGAFGSTDG